MFIRRSVAALLSLFCAFGAFAKPGAPVAPFHANYQVLRNGEVIGEATLSLRASSDGIWEFDSRTRGTSGMARLLGLDVAETSTFDWHAGHPRGLRYRYVQSAAIHSRTRDIDFDWKDATARVQDDNKQHRVSLQPNAIDRSLVTVALMADLQAHTPTLAYLVVHKDKVSQQHYVQSGRDTLDLPAGRIDAVRVDREGGSSKRHTTSWFAPSHDWLPVKIEQVGKHGETITLQLTATAK